jgi:glycosyltransferase involved in cell wall biosynthesis
VIRHSLVIPAYNEAALLPRLLRTVAVARDRYAGGADAVEVIVADNDSTDATPEIAKEAGCRVAHVAKRTIAAARNGGARVAQGEIVSFVDADSQIHPETFNAIDAAMARGDVVGGATGVDLERWSPGIAATWLVLMPLALVAGMDTGVVFCRRCDFDAVGGFDEERRYAEDVAFQWALKSLGRRRGQRFMRLKGVKAITSTRKFDRHGDWHYFTMILPRAIPGLIDKAKGADLAQEYWYTDRR